MLKTQQPVLLRTALKRYMSEGLLVAEGDRHKIQRKVVQRLFSRGALRMMADAVQAKADEVGSIREFAD